MTDNNQMAIPNVVITITDLYRSMEQMNTTLAGVAGDLKVMSSEIGNHTTDINDHEVRLRVLERSRWTAYGAIVVFNVIIAIVVAYISSHGFH